MNGSSLIPCLRYRDAPRAIDWLCDTLGFERHLVVPGDGGTVMHAQLRLGDGMVMLGSERDTDYGRLMRSPKDAGGSTQSVYVVVADPDSTYARAREKGAEIAVPIQDEAHGGRSFTCLDREGHVWTVGSYDPWAEPGSGAG